MRVAQCRAGGFLKRSRAPLIEKIEKIVSPFVAAVSGFVLIDFVIFTSSPSPFGVELLKIYFYEMGRPSKNKMCHL